MKNETTTPATCPDCECGHPKTGQPGSDIGHQVGFSGGSTYCKVRSCECKQYRPTATPKGCGYTNAEYTCHGGQLYDLDDCDDSGNLYEPMEYRPCPQCNTCPQSAPAPEVEREGDKPSDFIGGIYPNSTRPDDGGLEERARAFVDGHEEPDGMITFQHMVDFHLSELSRQAPAAGEERAKECWDSVVEMGYSPIQAMCVFAQSEVEIATASLRAALDKAEGGEFADLSVECLEMV